MATTKVSALSAKTSLAGSEELLINDSGTSKKVTATNLLAGVTVADGAISTAKLAADAVTGAKIADDAIDSEHYTDGSIDTAHIADDAVTAAKLANSINTDIATGVTANTTANAALPKSGGAMTGAITTNSTFDGRDVATDGAKLDGIEASADVTDATNVAAAGALMDSEVTNLAQVKAFDSSDYATAAQGTTADAALPKAGGTMTGNIAHASDFTIDVGGDITLDADGGDVKFSDGGTQFASVELNSTEVYFESAVSDNDIKIRGNDGGSTINMLSFDTSDAGKATFNSDIASLTGEFKLDDNHRIRVADDRIAFVLDGAEDMRLENDGDLHVEGDVIAYSTTVSDAALKYDINPVEFALDKINQLKGVSYKYKHNDRESAGLLAQDVEKVMPSAVTTKKLPLVAGDNKEYKTLHYDSMTAILVEAIKELTAKVKKLESK